MSNFLSDRHSGVRALRLVLLLLIMAMGTFGLFNANVYSASATWTGNTSTSWQTTTNWSPNTIPGAGNTVTFAPTATRTDLTTSASVSIGNIVVQAGTSGTTYVLGFTGANVLTITGAAGISNAGSGPSATVLILRNTALGRSQSWGGGTVMLDSTLSLGANRALTFNTTQPGGSGYFDGLNWFQQDSVITGTGTSRLIVTGAGALNLDNGNNTFTGGVILNGSASTTLLRLRQGGSNTPLGTGTLTLTNGTVVINQGILSTPTFANAISLNAGTGKVVTFTSGGANATWTGAMSTTGAAAKNLVFNAADQNFTGVFSGTSAVNVTGDGVGRMVLAGTSANTYSGSLTIGSGGTVVLKKTAGVNALGGTSTITVNSGGTLALGASNQLPDTKSLTLAGGVFQTQGYSEVLGTLTLSATSTIDLGGASSIINFADSNAQSWTGQLNISGWNGNVLGGGSTQLLFGSTASGLTGAQVAQIKFINPTGFAAGTYGATILASGEIVPVFPEASTILMGITLLAFIAFWEYSRRRRTVCSK
jgi:autotransporter-associated beta strand protein